MSEKGPADDKASNGELPYKLPHFSPSLLSASKITSLPDSFYYIPNFLLPHESDTLLSRIPSNRWVALSHRRLQVYPSALSPTTNTLLAAPLPAWLGPTATTVTTTTTTTDRDDDDKTKSGPTPPPPPSPILLPRLAALGVFSASPHAAPNHCLVNEYLPGQGIMPHEDGPAYWPAVATVSLGAGTVLDVYSKDDGDVAPPVHHTTQGEEGGLENEEDGSGGESGRESGSSSRRRGRIGRIYQEAGSLLVTTGEAYVRLLHGIEGVRVDEDLTARTVANWDLLREGTRRRIGKGQGEVERGTRTSLTFRDVVKVRKVGIGIVGRTGKKA